MLAIATHVFLLAGGFNVQQPLPLFPTFSRVCHTDIPHRLHRIVVQLFACSLMLGCV